MTPTGESIGVDLQKIERGSAWQEEEEEMEE